MTAFRRLAVACALLLAGSAWGGAGAADPLTIRIGYLTRAEEPRIPLTFLEPVVEDEGVQGARLAIVDNDTTGRFLNQRFELVEATVPEGEGVEGAVRGLAAQGIRLLVADLRADALLAADALPDARAMLILNARAPDDELRNERCRANLLHTAPSRRMLADALAQYLALRRWSNWMLVVGRAPEDAAFAEALRRAAKRYGARIVEEKIWSFEDANRRVDTGHVTLQSEIPVFTQGREHDVVVVADEADAFGEHLAYRTWLPRPVVGTHGLVPTAWSRVHEQWGATQLHSRFERQAGRWMRPRDYAAWIAVRAVGEAATRTNSADPAVLAAYIRGPDFTLPAFKGQGLSFRPWDGQLRQPVLLAGPRTLVSVSPQPGFLHQFSELDTLGDDQPETKCGGRG
ncbi:ABC transporter substrate-binding protein [Azospirillum doebereinerae]|uniref:ABC transporter substrate-binding protein n=1 Tax=Azospirillum doebereinerae TaxID=92933 RepID=UPI001EE55AC2|nr:ABC transporter substrate-binding protein [Azospirillum doebereinerae]MCG5238761.1 ABC transporter substrate-binding protein [Azospirillum doebereinerae]